jgi:hypothetical protein
MIVEGKPLVHALEDLINAKCVETRVLLGVYHFSRRARAWRNYPKQHDAAGITSAKPIELSVLSDPNLVGVSS